MGGWVGGRETGRTILISSHRHDVWLQACVFAVGGWVGGLNGVELGGFGWVEWVGGWVE